MARQLTFGKRKQPAGADRPAGGLWAAADDPTHDGPLLLDTHAWLWVLNGSTARLAREATALVDVAAAGRRLFVSDISFWEISLKAAKGRLAFSIDPTLWLARAAEAPGIQGIALTRNVLIQSTLLAGGAPDDPADRMLLAQAQLGGMSLLTCDAEIIAYARRQPGVPVCDAR